MSEKHSEGQADWGSATAFIDANYDKITDNMNKTTFKPAVKKIRGNTNHRIESLQKAFFRRKKNAGNIHKKRHGNMALTKFQESMVVGFLLMRSEVSVAATMMGARNFTKILLRENSGFPLPMSYAYEAICHISAYEVYAIHFDIAAYELYARHFWTLRFFGELLINPKTINYKTTTTTTTRTTTTATNKKRHHHQQQGYTYKLQS